MRSAGIILAGGTSSRMGAAKASLDWHGQPLAARVAGLLARAVDGAVVAVAPPGVEVPAPVPVVRDERPGVGPLAGLLAGLGAVGDAGAAVVAAVDAPLLHPRLVRRLLELLGPGDEAVVPFAHGHRHPLCAVYRPTAAIAAIDALLTEGVGAAGALPDRLATRWAEPADLEDADPGLGSLAACNTPGELAALLALPAPIVGIGGRPARGWTAAEALADAGAADPGGPVLIDGVSVPTAAGAPLAEGETLEPAAGEAR
jgi:molybdopterin-guanine dinucleotide biosynthesis protein A